MTADILHPHIEFFGAPSGQRIRVLLGDNFHVAINDAPEGFAWGTTNDPSLEVLDNGNVAVCTASKVGNSELQIQHDHTIPFFISVEVFSNEAATLGISGSVSQQ